MGVGKETNEFISSTKSEKKSVSFILKVVNMNILGTNAPNDDTSERYHRGTYKIPALIDINCK